MILRGLLGTTGGSPAAIRATFHSSAAMALALVIFALDVLSPLQGAVAVLYTIVVVIAARSGSRRLVLASGAFCAALALAGYVVSHGSAPLGSPAMRLGVSLVAILVTSLLCASQISTAKARRQADARYATIFDAAGFPIWESDWSPALRALRNPAGPSPECVRHAAAQSRVRNANLQAAKLFGYRSGADLVGKSIAPHYTEGAADIQDEIFRALRAGTNPVEVETQFVTLAGDVTDVVLRISLPAGASDWKRVLVTAIDVTERNRNQQRLAESHAELTHMARVMTLGQIAASIAHEVNQPLSAVINYAKSGRRWLQREAPEAFEVFDCLDQIAHNGSRAAEVIAGIRDLSRKADPHRAEVCVTQVFAETTALLARELRAANVTLRAAMSPELPKVIADRVQVQQVLMNLILNATHAMSDTPADQKQITVTAYSEGHFVEFAVSDRGPGLCGRDPETLFKPFFTTKHNGMGMGLTICRSIIEQQGGTLRAEPNEHGGLSMRFRLPEIEEAERAAK